MKNLYIFGISETANRVFQFVSRYKLYDIKGFVVDDGYKNIDCYLNHPVYTLTELQSSSFFDKEKDLLFVSIFWNNLNGDRRRVFERLKSQNFHFANIVSPLASIRGRITGENIWIMDNVIVQEDAEIADDVYIADAAIIGHLSKIEKHAFIALRALVCGGCIIGKQTFVGVNATIFDATKVGDKCLIGACTIIKRNVLPNTVCKTANDTIVIKQYPEDIIESKWQAKGNVR